MVLKGQHTNIPNFDRVLFWDTDVDKLDWRKAYKAVIARIVERGGQNEIDEIIRFYGYDKVVTAIRNEIYFLPNYATEKALRFFPELKKELLSEPQGQALPLDIENPTLKSGVLFASFSCSAIQEKEVRNNPTKEILNIVYLH